MSTFGATPAIPMPLSGEPIVLATCVPWPSSSSSAGSTQLGVLTRAVVDAGVGVVDGEVAAQEAVEVRRDVGVVAVDARVHDPDADGVAALIVRVGARRRGADELHVPLQPARADRR